MVRWMLLGLGLGLLRVVGTSARACGAGDEGALKWNFTTGDYVRSSPTVGADGTPKVKGEIRESLLAEANATPGAKDGLIRPHAHAGAEGRREKSHTQRLCLHRPALRSRLQLPVHRLASSNSREALQ